MKFWQLTSISISGPPLTNEIQEVLYQTAKLLMQLEVPWINVRSDCCVAHVQTDCTHVTLGTIVGIKFSAKVKSQKGTTTVAFIVSEEMLGSGYDERMIWAYIHSSASSAEKAWLN